jgi:uncharacterized membrane protein
MWNRTEVKAKGKVSFKRNYWNSVLVAFIYSLFVTGTSSAVSSNSDELNAKLNELNLEDPEVVAIILAVLAAVGVIICIATLVDIFLLNPLEVGCQRFFVVNQSTNAVAGELTHAYKNNYLNVVLGLFIKNLLITIGFILFIVPGVIMSYSYRLVPYILAEDTTISGNDAVKKSREMMKGHKWNAFVYDLSFIGWYLLAVLTCGILNFFYVAPYKMNADAALYQAIAGKTPVAPEVVVDGQAQV